MALYPENHISKSELVLAIAKASSDLAKTLTRRQRSEALKEGLSTKEIDVIERAHTGAIQVDIGQWGNGNLQELWRETRASLRAEQKSEPLLMGMEARFATAILAEFKQMIGVLEDKFSDPEKVARHERFKSHDPLGALYEETRNRVSLEFKKELLEKIQAVVFEHYPELAPPPPKP